MMTASQEPSTPSITDAQRRPDSRQEVVMNAPISSGEAWLLPILGSIVLLTLWLMLKYLNSNIVQMVFALYFAVAGVVSVWAVGHHPFKPILNLITRIL